MASRGNTRIHITTTDPRGRPGRERPAGGQAAQVPGAAGAAAQAADPDRQAGRRGRTGHPAAGMPAARRHVARGHQLEAAEAAGAPRADRQRQPGGWGEAAGGQVAHQGGGHRRPGQQEGDPGDTAGRGCVGFTICKKCQKVPRTLFSGILPAAAF